MFERKLKKIKKIFGNACQKQRNNVTNTKEYIAQKKNNKMKGTTMYPSVSFKEMSPLNNHRKKKNADILFTDHLQ